MIKQSLSNAATQPTTAASAIDLGPTQPVRRLRRRARGRNWQFWGAMLLVVGMAILLGTALAATVGWGVFQASDVIAPGVEALGVDLGGLTATEAARTLEQAWQQQTLALIVGDEVHPVSPATLGLTFDAAVTAQAAYDHYRIAPTLDDVLGIGRRVGIAPVVSLDPAAAEVNLRAMAPDFEIAPVNAGVQIVGGRAEAVPAVAGRAVDVPASVARLAQDAAGVVEAGRFPLATTAVAAPVSDVGAAVAQANELLALTLSIRAYDPVADETQVWTATPEVWGAWLSVQVSAGDPAHLDWDLDHAQVRSFLAAEAGALGAGRFLDLEQAPGIVEAAVANGDGDIFLQVYHNESQHIVQPGETLVSIARDYGFPYMWVVRANPGLGDSLSVGQALTIPSPDVLLPLPVVDGKRIVVSISEQRVWVYENGALKWEWLASTGIADSPTNPGVFQVQSHEANAYAANWDLWMPYFLGIYQPVPGADFMNGFHGFPARGGTTILWTQHLGRPVTYGCILISTENAALLYNWAEDGTIVEIRR